MIVKTGGLCRPWRPFLPPPRPLRVAGDELGSAARLIHLFRDSYAAAQGRQWLQAYVLAWVVKHLRAHNLQADHKVLASAALAERVARLGLPPGHPDVRPRGQATMNFDLWWSLFIDLVRMNHRPGPALPAWPRRRFLPDAAELEDRVWQIGLRPWMSSSNWEEVSGILRALEFFRAHDPAGRMGPDEVMVRVTLPGMLIAELHWLRKDEQGRPRKRGDPFEVIFMTRCRRASTAWSAGQYLTPLDAAYLRAGDIIDGLLASADRLQHPLLRRIHYLYEEMRQAYEEHHQGSQVRL